MTVYVIRQCQMTVSNSQLFYAYKSLHIYRLFRSSSCFVAVVELKTSNSLSMEELVSIFQNFHEWENKMVKIAVSKERLIMDGIANLLDKHKASDIAVKVLKGNQLTKVFMSYIFT